MLFTLLDFNDNGAKINQTTPAIYVIGGRPTSIGPEISLDDHDVGVSAINQITVTLTPDLFDASRTYDLYF